MSTSTPQQKAASETALWQSQLASQLSGITIPELQMLLGGPGTPGTPGTEGSWQVDPSTGERTWAPGTEATPGTAGTPGMLSSLLASTKGGTMPSTLDQSVLAGATTQLNQGYNQAEMASGESIAYQGLRSGAGRMAPGATSSAIGRAATSLERDRQTALNNLQFQSSVSSMADYNSLLGLMGQGVQTSLGLASGFGAATGSAIGGMSNQSPFGSALGGAASGAGIGATIGSGVLLGGGTLIGGAIGGIAGGLGGYFAGGG